MEHLKEEQEQQAAFYENIQAEIQKLEDEKSEAEVDKQQIHLRVEQSRQREADISAANEVLTEEINRIQHEIQGKHEEISAVNVTIAQLQQKSDFSRENIQRVAEEILDLHRTQQEVLLNASNSGQEIENRQHQIEEMTARCEEAVRKRETLSANLEQCSADKDAMNREQKGFFEKREALSSELTQLDKELFRLNDRLEKLEHTRESQTEYMWQEYELTRHEAEKQKSEDLPGTAELKKQISGLKEDIRKLGSVNVNAIEEYKEVSERYTFLKGQHEDLEQSRKTLEDIIADLDEGMKKQFAEKFADIQREFDKAFQELFGGGKGTLELTMGEDQDILDCGVRIIAQPPGKKLQNMMQLSGGEKALTAIALLFAIQNLKPSPFCLLDEIEAALDDSNVERYATYLHKLTQHTQFIVITHRRGTMVAADRLYGITMQEKGVSALVSVDLIESQLEQ